MAIIRPWSITYDCRSDDSGGVIYAPRASNCAPRGIYGTGVTHDVHHLRWSYFYSTGHIAAIDTF
jgi:hypothetical protein